MNKDTEKSAKPDEIDRIIGALIEDPTRANDVKTLLRQKIAAAPVVDPRSSSSASAEAAVSEEGSDEDIWDNMPV